MESILVCKTFGLGNAVMSVPMIKALRQKFPKARMDILIGDTPDDIGSSVVFYHLKESGIVDNIYINAVIPSVVNYDVAILTIPFDGRWKNGIHFHTKRVMDGRTRPDPSTTGLVSWKKHEVEYQMDNARELGFDGPTPSMKFCDSTKKRYSKKIYLGIGYKKDEAGFWKVKHWGNDNFAQLCRRLLKADEDIRIIMTGDSADMVHSMVPISKLVDNDRLHFVMSNMYDAISVIQTCHVYVGNDTGMMHVASSFDIPVVGFFKLDGSIVKNGPLSSRSVCLSGEQLTVDNVFNEVMKIIGG